MEPKLIWALLIGFTIIGVFALLLLSVNKDRNKRWDAIDPEKAQDMYYHGTSITPFKGHFFVRVSPHQWVQIFWDKNKESLIIQRPPDTYEHKQKYPIDIIVQNWKITSEHQPKRVGLEYFVRQVM